MGVRAPYPTPFLPAIALQSCSTLCGIAAATITARPCLQRVDSSPLFPCVSQVVTLWFDMRVWESIVAILFGIPLAVICIQCTGETDTTPTGAVGKVCY